MVSRALVILILIVFMAGCAFNLSQENEENAKPTARQTLSSVYFEPVPLNHDPLPTMDLASLRDAYQKLQGLLSDDETRQIVQYRLADLEVLLAEQKQESGLSSPQQGIYDLAINQYQQILAEHPQQEQNAEVLYQLAKAYDLQGQPEQSFQTIESLLQQYPDNPYLAEVYFRKGEILFAQNNYATAVSSYKAVLQQGEENPYFVTAAYMLGWSYFKLEQSHNALLAFTQLLDHRLPNNIIDQQMLSQVDGDQQLQNLPVGELRLVKDTLRIMALLFSYEGAEMSVIAHFEEVGERHYEHLLYDQLGQQFLNDDRYRDSAKVYQAFTQTHPAHSKAPFFAVKQIDAYILGKFPSLVLPAKQGFVSAYGITGEYWAGWGQTLQDEVKPFLHEYLQELAQFEHSKAQLLANNASTQSNDASATNAKSNADIQELTRLKRQAFASAANYYREFILTFPYDSKTPEMTFNLAESLFESENYIQAIEQYEIYAYQYLKEPKAAEAGYAAILSYRKALATHRVDVDFSSLRDQQLDSQARFVSRFNSDLRAVEVLHDSTQQLFELQRYPDAILAANGLLEWQPAVSSEKQMASLLVLAHSQFELGEFALAENYYDQIIARLDIDSQQRLDMVERLAASIYKQAELKLAENQIAPAVNDLLRVMAKAPASSVRINAQFDAATYLLELKEWQQATSLLEDFRTRFAGHSLNEGIGDKLIFSYQQSENWLAAATELLAVWKKAPLTEQGRQALLVAAQYFQQEGETQQALESFRTYAHRYPEPFDDAIEARFTMSEFYRSSKEDSKRRFWLNKLIIADADAGASRTSRSRYLAAMSSLVFADDKFNHFKRVKLSLPLSDSLKRKRAALDSALTAYNKTLDYQVAEFSTDANYKVANIYHQLAKDLMVSQRPKGLNQLELEQYDILLEEQAYPFEEKAIELHESNAQRSWAGLYDDWVKQSFAALATLQPGRYNKQEQVLENADEIY